MYDRKYTFSEYANVRKYYDLSLVSKYYILLSFFRRLNEFRNLTPRTEKKKLKRRMGIKNYKLHCYRSILKNTIIL